MELGQKLKTYLAEDEDFEVITAILEDFKKRGWLSDARFTEQIVHARSHKFGASKIAHELREKGVADELINDAIEKVKEKELENAREVWLKKYKNAPTSRDEWTRQARFLQSRGFGFDIIKKVLNTKQDDD
jgi:regulatory protein